MSGTNYIVHEQPVWRPSESYMAMVDLEPFGFENTHEQLWLRSLEDGGYEVCCIPFQVYGLALGDVVEVTRGRFVTQILRNSGRRALRIFFTAPRPSHRQLDCRGRLRQVLQAKGLLSEWSGERHVAIDIPEAAVADEVLASVKPELQDETVYWEWADAEAFSAGPRTEMGRG